MNNWTALHKHTKKTSLCFHVIPLFETVTPVATSPLERSTEKHCPAAEPDSHKKDHVVFYLHCNMSGSSVS